MDLKAEYDVLRAQQADLQREYERLKASPKDREGHRLLIARLKEHIERLHEYVKALRASEK